jgi:hypothetical protein
MFRTVFEALGDGSLVGIFPEGITHTKPSITSLKTGAARIALGATDATGGWFPIVPIGLLFQQKDVFRSEATAIVGDPIDWSDLAERGEDDVDAVLDLTNRIDAGIRTVTLNLERWEDQPIVECAEAVWAAERGHDRDPARMVERLRISTGTLAALRRGQDTTWLGLVDDIKAHQAALKRIRLSPAQLLYESGTRRNVGWVTRHFYLLASYVIAIGTTGLVLFYPAFLLTGLVVRVLKPGYEQRSANKLFVGTLIYGLWVVILTVLLTWWMGPLAGLATFVGLPALGIAGRYIREQWRGSLRDLRFLLVKRSRSEMIGRLRADQQDLAARIEVVLERAGDV